MGDLPTSVRAEHSSISAPQITSVSSSLKLFSVLSKPDNMKIFLAAKEGIKVHLLTSTHLQLSRKQYYKALKQLKDIGLIQKLKGVYCHTSFGKVVYQKNIIDVEEYARYSDGMQVLDAIKSTTTSRGDCSLLPVEDRFMTFIEKLTNMRDSRANTLKKIEVVWTYEQMVSLLLECIDLCKEEILIATRISPEIIIKTIQQKSKVGTKVRVLADEGLISEYFKLHTTDNLSLDSQDKNAEERIKVISNPWYPEEKNIERKICKVPFGMIIIDGKEIGIELIDQNDPHKFKAAVLLRDENTCATMKEYYQRIWDGASSDITQLKDLLSDKKNGQNHV
jgi:predicted transcriptional regulator